MSERTDLFSEETRDLDAQLRAYVARLRERAREAEEGPPPTEEDS